MAVDQKFIGNKYGPLTYEVGWEKSKEYARAIKNEDPHYMDKAFAASTKYGGVIVPPTFAVVCAGQLAVPFFLDPELKLDLSMLVHGEQAFEFFEVMRPGDVITTAGLISNIENKEKLDTVSLEGTCTNQHGRVVCKATFTFAIRRRG